MNDLIYNQNDIPKDTWRYGFRPSSATGCGWIATYNALRLLHRQVEIPALIRYFEFQLPLIHGNLGTSFWGPILCFRHWGFPLEITANPRRFDQITRRSDACILFYHWRKGARIGAHFIALQLSDGQILGYNTFRNSAGPDPLGASLEDFISRRRYFGCVLLGIREDPLSQKEKSPCAPL